MILYVVEMRDDGAAVLSIVDTVRMVRRSEDLTADEARPIQRLVMERFGALPERQVLSLPEDPHLGRPEGSATSRKEKQAAGPPAPAPEPPEQDAPAEGPAPDPSSDEPAAAPAEPADGDVQSEIAEIMEHSKSSFARITKVKLVELGRRVGADVRETLAKKTIAAKIREHLGIGGEAAPKGGGGSAAPAAQPAGPSAVQVPTAPPPPTANPDLNARPQNVQIPPPPDGSVFAAAPAAPSNPPTFTPPTAPPPPAAPAPPPPAVEAPAAPPPTSEPAAPSVPAERPGLAQTVDEFRERTLTFNLAATEQFFGQREHRTEDGKPKWIVYDDQYGHSYHSPVDVYLAGKAVQMDEIDRWLKEKGV